MKKTLLLLLIILVAFGQTSAQNENQNESEENMLICPRIEQFPARIDKIIDCTRERYLELVANDIFSLELEPFDKEVVAAIILDDVSNPNWLTQKGVYELRKNRLCLENICDLIWNKCNTRINQSRHLSQKEWCDQNVDNIFEIQKVKVEIAVLENQQRKTRSAWREKFRGIEVRTHRYFIPNLISFVVEFKIFTEKVTSFILNPLS